VESGADGTLEPSPVRHRPVPGLDSMIDVRFIGGIEVHTSRSGGDRAKLTQPKRLALFMYLALAEPAGLHSRDRLLALLWPEADDASSRHSLRNALHALRQALGEEVVVTRGESWVGLDLAMLRCDVLELRAHLAANRLDDAIASWSGDLAPGFHLSGAPEFDRWLEEQRRALGHAVRTAAWSRAHQLEGTGAAELQAVRRAIHLDPGNEPGARWLMHLLATGGDRSGALRAYQDLAGWLAHELETEPSAETRTAAERLRGDDAAKQPGAPRRVTNDLSSTTTPMLVESSAPRAPGPRVRRAALAIAVGTAVMLGAGVYVSQAGITGRVGGSRARASFDSPAAEAEQAALRLPARYRTDTAAYSSYLRGLTLRFQFQFKASRDTLAALVDREPLYVPGLYGLAHTWIFLAITNQADPDDAWPRIGALARRALALDSTAANAWLVLASEDEYLHQNLPRAGERLLHARRLDPLDPDVAGMRSVWFRFHGEMDSAIVEARVAHRLDPFSLMHERLLAKQLFYARRYEEARQSYLRLLQNSAGRMRGYRELAQVSVAMNRPREAVDWLRQSLAAEGDSAGAAALPAAETDYVAERLLAADARRTIARLDDATRTGGRAKAAAYAQAYAALRDTTATLRWLDSMRVRRDSYLHLVRVDPAFDFLRGTAEYRTWEARTALPTMRTSGVTRDERSEP
jgi:DNA-binding SARP family transcriptional activator